MPRLHWISLTLSSHPLQGGINVPLSPRKCLFFLWCFLLIDVSVFVSSLRRRERDSVTSLWNRRSLSGETQQVRNGWCPTARPVNLSPYVCVTPLPLTPPPPRPLLISYLSVCGSSEWVVIFPCSIICCYSPSTENPHCVHSVPDCD